jgi:hypothetical protein
MVIEALSDLRKTPELARTWGFLNTLMVPSKILKSVRFDHLGSSPQ